MNPATRTPEGQSHRCPVCGKTLAIEPSRPSGDAPCPHCGCLLWFPAPEAGAGDAAFQRLTVTDPSIRMWEQAIRHIVDHLAAVGALNAVQRQEVLAGVLKREQLGSTAIGRGVALPHASCASLNAMVGAIAEFPLGLEFDSSDGAPVHVVCLFAYPTTRPGAHLRILEALARRWRAP